MTRKKEPRPRPRPKQTRVDRRREAADLQRVECNRRPHPAYVRTNADSGRSHLPAFYVRLELGRIFPGAWSYQVLEANLSSGAGKGRCRALVRLSVTFADGSSQAFDGDGDSFEDVRGDLEGALGQARKSAISDAIKRAAVNLGVAFGLGLYDDQDAQWGIGGMAEGWPNPSGPRVPELRQVIGAAMSRHFEPWTEHQVGELLVRHGALIEGQVSAANIGDPRLRRAVVIVLAGPPPS